MNKTLVISGVVLVAAIIAYFVLGATFASSEMRSMSSGNISGMYSTAVGSSYGMIAIYVIGGIAALVFVYQVIMSLIRVAKS